MKKAISNTQLLLATVVTVALLLTPAAFAAAPGITGPTFNLTAQQAFISQPDGNFVYSWGYGCVSASAPSGFAPTLTGQKCPTMQVPGPTLIVTQGQTVTVNLTNNLPNAAGNTSILFPGFNVTATGGIAGLLTKEAGHALATSTVTYTFVASTPGTRAYYSGTQGDLQVEMGLYGAIIVLPSAVPASCNAGVHASNVTAQGSSSLAHPGVTEHDFRLAHAAYNHPGACYDREYLFQYSEMDPRIHRQAEEQAGRTCPAGAANTGCMEVATEPYVPAYFMINGRSMPDLMDPNYAPEYPHQPYNGNPHMHPGELTLLRIIGTGRWQHPFHEHGNHVRILARDGNLIQSTTDPANNLAGPLLFTTTTTPGLAMDGIYYWTGKGLNWDAYGHNPSSSDPNATLSCTPDANGYNTGAPTAINYFEWCQDHNKPLQAAPFGDVAGGGPATLPDPNIFANGPWFGGSPYLGPNATVRAVGSTGTTPPSGTVANSPTDEAGFAFMWHSHNEREITTNNIFPGGMLMMMLVDSREFVIDESK
ncbi:MAG: multicopper oxidase family protein [Acidobacteriia bacterium]|nr:multicopper oxidase family protein [Terriglobia bacterium]